MFRRFARPASLALFLFLLCSKRVVPLRLTARIRSRLTLISQETVLFLSDASSNGSDEWLYDNKARLNVARLDLVEFTSKLFTSASSVDGRLTASNADPRKCLAKAPIAKGVGMISFRTQSSRNAAATYFVKIAPFSSYSGGGALSPSPRHTRILRQTIASYTGKWRAIVEGPLFEKYFPNGLSGGDDLASRGYVKNHDALDFFSLANFGACRSISMEMLACTNLIEETVKSFAAARALVDYINRATTALP